MRMTPWLLDLNVWFPVGELFRKGYGLVGGGVSVGMGFEVSGPSQSPPLPASVSDTCG